METKPLSMQVIQDPMPCHYRPQRKKPVCKYYKLWATGRISASKKEKKEERKKRKEIGTAACLGTFGKQVLKWRVLPGETDTKDNECMYSVGRISRTCIVRMQRILVG
jgi:hypothetical protein